MKERNAYQLAFDALPPHLKEEALRHLLEQEKPVLDCDFGTADRDAIIQRLVETPDRFLEAGSIAAPVVEQLINEGIATGIVERFSNGTARKVIGVGLSRETRREMGPYRNGSCPQCGKSIWYFENNPTDIHCPHCNSILTICR